MDHFDAFWFVIYSIYSDVVTKKTRALKCYWKTKYQDSGNKKKKEIIIDSRTEKMSQLSPKRVILSAIMQTNVSVCSKTVTGH